MAESNTNVELRFDNVALNVAVQVDISAFVKTEIFVEATKNRVLAVRDVDYTIGFVSGSTSYRDGFTITPLAGLIAKIVATGLDNIVYVSRRMGMTTSFQETDAFARARIVDEFDRTIMRIQQLDAAAAHTITVPFEDAPIEFPGAGERANKVLEFDADGNPVAINTLAGLSAGIAQVAQDRIAVSQDKAEVSQMKTDVSTDRTAVAQDRATVALIRNDVSDLRDDTFDIKQSVLTIEGNVANDALATAADRVATGQDRTATAADRVATGQDRTATAADRVAVANDKTTVANDKTAVANTKTAVDAVKVSVDASLVATRQLYQGSLTADPTVDLGGAALTNKAYYYNTVSLKVRFYNTALPGWQDSPVGQAAVANQMGQCKFICISTTQCRLVPYNGNKIFIGGVVRTLPSAGINIANGAIVGGGALVYIYAYWTGTVVALDPSTTGHVTDATYGHEVKVGDASRTLVGMVMLDATTFADNERNRYVRSWYNDTTINLCTNTGSATVLLSATTQTEIDPLARAGFLCWAGESISGTVFASFNSTVANALVSLGAGVSTTTTESGGPRAIVQNPYVGVFSPISAGVYQALPADAWKFLAAIGYTGSSNVCTVAHLGFSARVTRG